MNVFLNKHQIKIALTVISNSLPIFVKFVIYLIMIFRLNKFIIVIYVEFVGLEGKIKIFIAKRVRVAFKIILKMFINALLN
jgi:hypothetical protein